MEQLTKKTHYHIGYAVGPVTLYERDDEEPQRDERYTDVEEWRKRRRQVGSRLRYSVSGTDGDCGLCRFSK